MRVPTGVIEWVYSVFRDCNNRLSDKISNNPNTQETSLDHTLIEHLSRHASPIVFGNDWTVRIDTHFIGGRRHFYGWEIADIGVLVFFRRNGKIINKKIALLQSKRLYPLSGTVDVESPEDVLIGISTLMPDATQQVLLSNVFQYEFNGKSKYKALRVKDDQYGAIY